MLYCSRPSALRRSPKATLWWLLRRWPRFNHLRLGPSTFGESSTNFWSFILISWVLSLQITLLTILYHFFQPSPCLQWMGKRGPCNNACWVFKDTELEIFPWKGPWKVSRVFFRPHWGGLWRNFATVGNTSQATKVLRSRILTQRLWWRLPDSSSEQRNCLVILRCLGPQLNLAFNLDQVNWFRVNVRSVELSSTQTSDPSVPTHISIPWTPTHSPLFSGNFLLLWF